MHRPPSTEYAPYYEKYMALVLEQDILTALQTQLGETLALLSSVPEAQGNVRHPPYTWSVKEVVGHLTDTERVFGYRIMRFARGDATPLPGFDENAYVQAADFDHVPLRDLVNEFEALRRSHLYFLGSLSDAAWLRVGQADGKAMSVRAGAYILAGHARHHVAILRKRLSRG